MKIRLLFSVVMVCQTVLNANAQPAITAECNRPRPKDCLVKQLVEYKNPGQKGEADRYMARHRYTTLLLTAYTKHL